VALKTVRALLTAHVQSQWNQTLRQSGLAEKASTIAVFILVILVLMIPAYMTFKYGMYLGDQIKETPESALLFWCGLQAQFTVVCAILGGFRHKITFSFKEVGRYPLPLIQVILAEIPAGFFEVFPILGGIGILFSNLGLAVKLPEWIPLILFLTIHGILSMLILLVIAGSAKRFLMKQSKKTLIIGLIILLTVIFMSKAEIRLFLRPIVMFFIPIFPVDQPYIPFLPGSQGYAGMINFMTGGITGGVLLILGACVSTTVLLILAGWIHYKEFSTEHAASKTRKHHDHGIKFRFPVSGISLVFLKQLLASISVRLILFVCFLITSFGAVGIYIVRQALSNSEVIPPQMAMITERVQEISFYGLMLYFLVLFNSDIWMNQFGWDRGGIRTLLTLPISTKDLLLGKMMGIMRFYFLQILIASVPLLFVYTPSLSELIGGIAAAGTLLLICTAIGHLISVRFPRPIHRDGSSNIRFSLLWIPLAFFITISLCLTLVKLIGRFFGDWGSSLSMVVVLGITLIAYFRTLPYLSNEVYRNRENLLRLS
jgi:hypothetical protein